MPRSGSYSRNCYRWRRRRPNVQPLDLIIIALATFYLAYSLTLLEGPLRAFVKFRYYFALGGLTECVYCMALWIGLLFYWLYTTALQPVVITFAVAGLGMAVYRYTGA